MCEDYFDSQFTTLVLTNSITGIIVAINYLLKTFTIMLITWIGYDTHSEMLTKITNGVFLAQFFNTALVLLLVERPALSRRWQLITARHCRQRQPRRGADGERTPAERRLVNAGGRIFETSASTLKASGAGYFEALLGATTRTSGTAALASPTALSARGRRARRARARVRGGGGWWEVGGGGLDINTYSSSICFCILLEDARVLQWIGRIW